MVTVDNFETHHFNNELYEIQNNRWDWEKRYLHVNYSQNLDTNLNVTMVGIFAFVFCSIEMFKDFLYTIFFFFPAMSGRVLVPHGYGAFLRRVGRRNGKLWPMV